MLKNTYNNWILTNCLIKKSAEFEKSRIDSLFEESDTSVDRFIKMYEFNQKLEAGTATPKDLQPYVKDTKNFYISSYVCPYCKQHMYKTVFPTGFEYLIVTEQREFRIKRIFSCDTCKTFFAPLPGLKLASGTVLINKLESTSYSRLLKEIDKISTTDGRLDL
ncbi:MAG: hypothetical protein GX309_09405 [Clostridiales bacterium]|nr:hypothetical protein [Clostridiales bacterium]